MATYTAGAFILSGEPGNGATTVTEMVDFNISYTGGLTILYQPAVTTVLEDWSDIHSSGTEITGTVDGTAMTYQLFLSVAYGEVKFLDQSGGATNMQGYRVQMYTAQNDMKWVVFPVQTTEQAGANFATHQSNLTIDVDQTTAVGSIQVGYTTESMSVSTDYSMDTTLCSPVCRRL